MSDSKPTETDQTMKKYPFPPGVTSMSGPGYLEHCRVMGIAERAAKSARRAHLDAMRARRVETRASGPTARITALSVGASVMLAGYQKTTKVSSYVRNAYIATGGRYTSALARDLMDGQTVIGVTVTRIE